MLANLQNIIVGGVARINLVVKNHLGVLTDAIALRLIVKDSANTVTVYRFGIDNVITKDSVGHYHANVTMTSPGNWIYRWESDAPSAGADEGRITVKKSLIS